MLRSPLSCWSCLWPSLQFNIANLRFRPNPLARFSQSLLNTKTPTSTDKALVLHLTSSTALFVLTAAPQTTHSPFFAHLCAVQSESYLPRSRSFSLLVRPSVLSSPTLSLSPLCSRYPQNISYPLPKSVLLHFKDCTALWLSIFGFHLDYCQGISNVSYLTRPNLFLSALG